MAAYTLWVAPAHPIQTYREHLRPLSLALLDQVASPSAGDFSATAPLNWSFDTANSHRFGYTLISNTSLKKINQLAIKYQLKPLCRYSLSAEVQSDIKPVPRRQSLAHDSRDSGHSLFRALAPLLCSGTQAEQQCPAVKQLSCDNAQLRHAPQCADRPDALDWQRQLKQRQCHHYIANLPDATDLASQVRSSILHCAASTSVDQLAASMHLSSRTLRRRLQEQGLSFSKLHNDTLMALAMDYLLHTSLSIQQVAFSLRYTHATSFCRAFRKHYGVPPERIMRTVNMTEQ